MEAMLRQVPLLATLPDSELRHLAETLRQEEVPAGTILLREGHADDHFLMLLAGEVEIIKALGTADERQMATRRAGALLGEMSLFTQDGCHTASVRALTPLRCVRITRTQLDALLHRQPALAYALVRVLSRRLEESENHTILDLREKNRELTLAYQELQAAQAQIVEKERLERELEVARHIQESILPHEMPQCSGFDFGASMIPARAVGGDFYDFIPLDRDHLGIVVGDVSDKGVPAAFFMALTYSLVRAEAGRSASPASTLRAVNRLLLDMNSSGMFVTLLYGVLNCASGGFTYARAGHPRPLILDAQGTPVRVPSGPGQPLGLFDEPLLDEQTFAFPAGGLALIFSDGLSEASASWEADFGLECLRRAVPGGLQLTAQGVCDCLWEEVQARCGQSAQQDDFTVEAIQVMVS
jgi:sigma-B regulation protein RsbU (phosphoserine phosphatase)